VRADLARHPDIFGYILKQVLQIDFPLVAAGIYLRAGDRQSSIRSCFALMLASHAEAARAVGIRKA
jgi:hypothetical protein